jgi:hypothetical protein
MTSQQVYKLLIGAGFDPASAANFVGIAQAESGYKSNALNNNPKTGDYSVGLWQENFFQSLGPARVARYAPMFPGAPTTVSGFTAWLQTHPEAQAKIALDLYHSSGYSPWKGDAFVSAHPELLAGAAGNVFGTPPPFTSNLPAAAKPPVIPISVTNLLNAASRNASKAKQLGNLGGTAKRYLQDQLDELQAADDALHKLTPKSAADKATISKQITRIENAMDTVRTEIKKSLLVTGDALIPAKLRDRLAAANSKFAADSAYAQSLTGTAADAYKTTIRDDLLSQAAILTREQSGLKAKLAASTGRQRTAVQTELTKVTGSLQGVQQQILSNLQGIVSTLQGTVNTAFQSVAGELQAKFEAGTQELIDQADATYFQNGAQTPLEAQLAGMQAADTLQSLQDAVNQATDATSRAAAQRQLDEYNLSLRAQAERTKADSDYAAAVKKIQADRSAAEAEMNKKLATLSDAFQNGTGKMADLTAIATAYGLQIDTTTIPDFDNLSGSVGELQQAFSDLAGYIATITGTSPKIPAGAGGSAGSTLGSAASATYQQYAQAAVAKLLSEGITNVHQLGVPQLDIGTDYVARDGLAYLHRGEAVVPAAVNGPYGTGGSPHIVVNGFVGNEAELARQIGRLLQKANQRGMRFQIA